MSRRAAIRMSDAEVRTLLDAERTLVCATHGPHGWPHLMPLWYVVRDGELWAWTYAKSQKAVNLARDPRATVQVEAGESYDELRGVMLECETVVHREPDAVAAVGLELARRYGGGGDAAAATAAGTAVRAQAPKRVALQFVERRRVTWDHRKLGGAS